MAVKGKSLLCMGRKTNKESKPKNPVPTITLTISPKYTNNPTSENYKLLGNLMIKNHFYEKAIYYYKEAIKLNKNDPKLEIILYSNLSEAYIKYGYYTKFKRNKRINSRA